MWINKIKTSLYVSIFIEIALSALVSLVLFLGLIWAFNSYAENKHFAFITAQHSDIKQLIDKIQETVTDKNLTFEVAKNSELAQKSSYTVEFFIISDLDTTDFSSFGDAKPSTTQYVFPIKFADAHGFAKVTAEGEGLKRYAFIIIAALASAFIFFFSSVYLIFKELSYLKLIEQGVNSISTGNILHKIPIKGENELAKLAASVNLMGQNLHEKIEKEQENEKNKKLLITNMSHDLRTPLTSIIGFTDVAKNKLDPTHEIYAYLVKIQNNGKRLEKLINDLFLYSKLLSNDLQVNLETMDINFLLRQMLDLKIDDIVFKPSPQKCPAQIEAEMFCRVIDNLLSNAKIHGVRDEQIELATHGDDNCVWVEITNKTAENLAPHLDKLANRLYSATENRAGGSSGLGLSIVCELLKYMNGELSFSCVDKTFTARVTIYKVSE